jgi:hypothetical protein
MKLKIKAKDLRRGNSVKMKNGKVLKVEKIGVGFAETLNERGKTERCVLIDWSDGSWSQLGKSHEIEIIL